MIRSVLVRLHRYGGLALAAFLTLAGLTGSLIVFYHELDGALNPDLFQVPISAAPALSPSEMAVRLEAQLPGAEVSLIGLNEPKGHAVEAWVQGKSAVLPYDQVFADPVTGRLLGKRKWGEAGLSRAALMPMIYVFHYTLKLPGVWGTLLMGIIACLWTLDCLFAFVLTLPRGLFFWKRPFWKKWGTAWRIKAKAGSYRLNFDLHRAGGLWLWGVLLILATSGVAMNLPDQVFRPVVKLFAPLSPSVAEVGAPRLKLPPAPPAFGYDEALVRMRKLARHENVVPRYIFHYAAYHAYGLGYSRDAQGDGMDGWGLSYLYIDDRSGAVLLNQPAGQGRAADIYAGAQFQLHSGRILGWPGRILVCLTGLATAMLSVTGVIIWLRKRAARKAQPATAIS